VNYDALAGLGRAQPGERVKVWTFDRGTDDEMRRLATRLRTHLTQYLAKKCPLERWSFSSVPSEDPWGGYEVFVTFHGEAKNAAEKGKWKAQRRRRRARQE
jgi:hypothetical protein